MTDPIGKLDCSTFDFDSATTSNAGPLERRATGTDFGAQKLATVKACEDEWSQYPDGVAHPAVPVPSAAEPLPVSCSQACANGYAPDAMAELQKNPTYQSLQADAAVLKALEDGNGLGDIDRMYGGWFGAGLNDGKINLGNVTAAANDGLESAKYFLNNSRLFHEMDADGDGCVSAAELHAFYAGVKDQIAKMETGAKECAAATDNLGKGQGDGPGIAKTATSKGSTAGTSKGSGGASQDSASGTSGTSASRSKAEKETDLEKALAPPYDFKSKSKDPEGRLNDANQYLGDYADKLQNELIDAAASGDTARTQALQAKLAKITMCQQMLSQLQQQLYTQTSNMMKLYSDMAMTAIRNAH